MIDIRTIPVLYINIDHNTDRRNFMESHLVSIGCNKIQRIPAVYAPKNGYDGNIISHIKAAYNAFTNNTDDFVLVLEDDGMILDIENINEEINSIIHDNPHISVINIHPPDGRYRAGTIASPPHVSVGLHCCILYRRENIMSTIYRYLLSWLVTGVIDRIGSNDVNYAVIYTNAYRRLGHYFISNCEQTLTRVYIKHGPYNHTYDELSGNITVETNNVIMRFYYVDTGSVYEVTPYMAIPLKHDGLYSDDNNRLIMNIYTYLRNLGAKLITINDGCIRVALDPNEFIMPRK